MVDPVYVVGLQPVVQLALTELTSFMWGLWRKKPGEPNTGLMGVHRKPRTQPGTQEGFPEHMWTPASETSKVKQAIPALAGKKSVHGGAWVA